MQCGAVREGPGLGIERCTGSGEKGEVTTGEETVELTVEDMNGGRGQGLPGLRGPI